MAKLTYKNPEEASDITIRLMKVNSMTASKDAIPYSEEIELTFEGEGATEDTPTEHTFTIGERGYYAVFVEDDDEFVYDDDFGVHVLNFDGTSQPSVRGYNIIETPNSIILKLFISDEDNTATELSRLVFELNYAFIKSGDDVPFNYIQTPLRAHSAIKRAQAYHNPILELDAPKSALNSLDAHNKAVITDPLYYQHKLYFMGDTVVIPKLYDDEDLELVFRVRASYIGSREGFNTVSSTFQVPVKGIEVDRPVIAFDSETPSDPTSARAYVVAITGTFDPATVEDVSNWELKFNDVKQGIDSVSLSKDTVVISFEKNAEVGDIVFIQALAAAFSDYHTDSNVISYEVAK